MKVRIRGKKNVTLRKSDFRARGGEGSVYVRNGTAFKIYDDPASTIPEAKIAELGAITAPNVVRPLEVVEDEHGQAIGYTMLSVEDAFTLCQLFPPVFRQREGLTPEKAFSLVRKMRDGVRHVHERGILVVDLNEMNFLVDRSFDEVFFIDVDSYQTRSFAATALMESVRDRHATRFDEGSDWFSFAVVTFQLFVGLHPYRGTYPPMKGTVAKDAMLDARMRANVSVLNPAVARPAACLPLDVIPRVYLDWYEAVLERGLRAAPPDGAYAAIATAAANPVMQPTAGGTLAVSELYAYGADVVAYVRGVVLTADGVYAGSRRIAAAPPGARIAILASGRAVLAWLEGRRLRLVDTERGREIDAAIAAEAIAASDGRVYAKHGDGLFEIRFVETPSRVVAAASRVGNVHEHATQLFDGVAIHSLLGAWHASLLPESGRCVSVRVPELDGYAIVDARFESGVLVIVAARGGVYDRFVFRFDDRLRAYDVRVMPDVASTGVNFTVLDSGVCLLAAENDELEVFSKQTGSTATKIVSDPAVRSDARLFHAGSQALFARGTRLFRFSMGRGGSG